MTVCQDRHLFLLSCFAPLVFHQIRDNHDIERESFFRAPIGNGRCCSSRCSRRFRPFDSRRNGNLPGSTRPSYDRKKVLRRIVPTVARPGHRLSEMRFLGGLLEGTTGIVRALIRVDIGVLGERNRRLVGQYGNVVQNERDLQ